MSMKQALKPASFVIFPDERVFDEGFGVVLSPYQQQTLRSSGTGMAVTHYNMCIPAKMASSETRP